MTVDTRLDNYIMFETSFVLLYNLRGCFGSIRCLVLKLLHVLVVLEEYLWGGNDVFAVQRRDKLQYYERHFGQNRTS